MAKYCLVMTLTPCRVAGCIIYIILYIYSVMANVNIICEVLCFILNKFGKKLQKANLKSILLGFYTDEELLVVWWLMAQKWSNRYTLAQSTKFGTCTA